MSRRKLTLEQRQQEYQKVKHRNMKVELEKRKVLAELRKKPRCQNCTIILKDNEIKYCSECLPKIEINDKDLV